MTVSSIASPSDASPSNEPLGGPIALPVPLPQPNCKGKAFTFTTSIVVRLYRHGHCPLRLRPNGRRITKMLLHQKGKEALALHQALMLSSASDQ